eukprot:m.347479 g.347479  ORF g.347479 m.347479 type:complete len:58 (+) comp19868_c0_seq2:2894-3067(+)
MSKRLLELGTSKLVTLFRRQSCTKPSCHDGRALPGRTLASFNFVEPFGHFIPLFFEE